MDFERVLDQVIGQRELIHEVECSVCGHFEAYYRDPDTKENLGRACEYCGDIQKFD